MSSSITCARCGLEQDRMGFKPFPNALGQRLYDSICNPCWQEWLNLQKQLINHYALDVRDAQAKAFLTQNMEKFLFDGEQ